MRRLVVALMLVFGCSKAPPIASRTSALVAAPKYTLFEADPVRPLALSNGFLYAANKPDSRLEIFRVTDGGLQWLSSVVVGLEPVAVAARCAGEVWVVNQLSDDISIVDVSNPLQPRVVRTLLVGDEPRDIVFGGGAGKSRAFITTAHRGQNNPNDPQLLTQGVPRADVWVFDANNLGASLGGTPLTIVNLFTDTPRALAVTPDGKTVFAAGFKTTNRTTVINELTVAQSGMGLPPPLTDAAGEPQPNAGLIVKFKQTPTGMHWVDNIGRVWDQWVYFSLPDKDVFAIDATANPPAQLAGNAGFFQGVGTVLFNMVVNPKTGSVYVSNTDAQNDHRFAGAGVFAQENGSGPTVQGHVAESHITVLSNGNVLPRHLNKHIDYTRCCAPLPNDEAAKSLADPVQMVVSSDGSTLYVAAHGSSKVGIFSTAQLEADTFVPNTANQIVVSGGGPSGLALDEYRGRLYVMTHFDNGISIINTNTQQEIAHFQLFNPEPASITQGRSFLYDAANTSSHGDTSCASCHVFADFDRQGWDLGDPDALTTVDYNPVFPPFNPFYPAGQQLAPAFAPMKGPMTTQSLRGLANHGPMHWRGDRTGSGLGITNAPPSSGSYDTNAAFNAFNAAFNALNGLSGPIPTANMQAFTTFALQLTYPPNPIHNLDESLTADQQAGEAHFVLPRTDDRCPPGVDCNTGSGVQYQFACADCHSEDQGGSSLISFRITFDPVRSQAIKNPHFRNLYQKVGMFGMPQLLVQVGPATFLPGTEGTAVLGDQISGFGNIHDGSFAGVDQFLSNASFANFVTPNGFDFGHAGDAEREPLDQYLLAFDTDQKPIVGQQITFTSANAAVTGPRADLLIARDQAGDCELIAKLRFGREVGFVFDGTNWIPDIAEAPPISDAQLRQFVTKTGLAVTYSAVPIGSGQRLGIDADLDGYLDGDEEFFGSNPRDPRSTPQHP